MSHSGSSSLIASSASVLHCGESSACTGICLGSFVPPYCSSVSSFLFALLYLLLSLPLPLPSLLFQLLIFLFPLSPLLAFLCHLWLLLFFVFGRLVSLFSSSACSYWFPYDSCSCSGSFRGYAATGSFFGFFCCFFVLCRFPFVVCFWHFTFSSSLYCCCSCILSSNSGVFFLFSFCLGSCSHFRLLVFVNGPFVFSSFAFFPFDSCSFSSSSWFLAGRLCASSSYSFDFFSPPVSSRPSFALPAPSSGILVDPGAHFSGGAPPSASCGSGLGFAGASCASVPDNAFLYHGFDDSSVKGDFSKAFHFFFFFFFFYEWEHRTGTMCPFSSLHPSRNGKERE